MEIRKMDFNKIESKCCEEGKNYIPSNWYIDARKAWSIFTWCMIQIRCGATIRRDSDVESFVHKFWEYIEDRAIAVGEENDGTSESNPS